METKIIENVLARCRVADIKSILGRWSYLTKKEIEELNLKQTKKFVIQKVLALCKGKENLRSKAEDLDLIFAQTHSTKWKWSAFILDTQRSGKDEASTSALLCNPSKFKQEFMKQVAMYFIAGTSVRVKVHNGAFWVRLYINEGNQRIGKSVFNRNNTVYLVHYPKTRHILITRLKAQIQQYILQSVQNTLKAKKITNMQLTGHHVDSLFQLALQKNSQGSFSKYKDRSFQSGPLTNFKPQKRKAPEREVDENVFSENEVEMQKRAKILEDSFGPNEQPVLEKVEYKLLTKFRGTDSAPGMSRREEPFKCSVKFEGTNVLEGFRNLCNTGLAKMPLPSHLGSVHSLAKNYLVIQDGSMVKQKK